jgi:hypothetical protein
MAYTRTTSPISVGRFTPGYPDTIFAPTGGSVAGKCPAIYITGLGGRGNMDPALLQVDDLLGAICDEGYTICQPDIPAAQGSSNPGEGIGPFGASGNPWDDGAFGNPAAIAKIEDVLDWGRNPANGIGWSNDPPIMIGVSHGAMNSYYYAFDNDVTGLIGVLPVSGLQRLYDANYAAFQGGQTDAEGSLILIEQSVSDPPMTRGGTLPTYFDLEANVGNYDKAAIRGRIQWWYTGNDDYIVEAQMSCGAQMAAEMHNLGAYMHLGVINLAQLFDPNLGLDAGVILNQIDLDRVAEFLAEVTADL